MSILLAASAHCSSSLAPHVRPYSLLLANGALTILLFFIDIHCFLLPFAN